MSNGHWGLKEARIGLWALLKERAQIEERTARLELELAECQERAAILDRQIPLYEAEVLKFTTADPRDDVTPFELQADDADNGAYGDVA